ncbi:MAG: AAA family ATPase, partial [Kiritimatiellae bacterium]|nr:AAA family ATPase [Kiritimatiellia bacterium]
RARSPRRPVVQIADVHAALATVHADAYARLAGPGAMFPESAAPGGTPEAPPDDGCSGEPGEIRYSADVDRYLSPYGGILPRMLAELSVRPQRVDSLHIAAAFLWEPIPEIAEALAVAGLSSGNVRNNVAAALEREAAMSTAERRREGLADTFGNIAKIRKFLKSRCIGQDAAVESVVTQLSLAWALTPPSRGRRPLSFFFAGAPGTGKTFLAESIGDAFAKILGIPKIPVVDFARFATEQMPIDLVGRDTNWQGGGNEGLLTGAARRNPRGVFIIDNYEAGHPIAVSYLDTILETGHTRDGFWDEDVSFSDNVFVIVTHKKEFAESDELEALAARSGGTLPRDKVVEVLARHAPSFLSTLRLVDAPLLFKKHTCDSFRAIARAKLAALADRFRKSYGAEFEFDPEVLDRLLVEMQPDVQSAHPVGPSLESAILTPLQQWLMAHYRTFRERSRIRLAADPFPALDGAPERDAFPDFGAWLAAHNEFRLRNARRLSFAPVVADAGDAVEVRFSSISYLILPSIEDCGYFTVTAPDVSFDDLVGVGLVRDRIREVLDDFNHPGERRARGDTGIVLYGPPGTGKTSVAKAIAHELGTPFIMVTGTDFTKPCRGEGIEAVHRLFAAARRYGAVVFVDEIDALGSRDAESPENARIVNAFLTELDGFRERDLLVIGATNRYEVLDEALVRPGRLSLKIQLGLLHSAEDRRRLVLKTAERAGAALPEELVGRLVETTNSWSPANLVALVNGGLKEALRAGSPPTFAHFAKARTVILLGEDPQSVEHVGHELRLTAVHEAGHAVVAALRGIHFVQATVQGVGATAGFVEHLGTPGYSTRKDLARLIDMTLAGRAAEDLLAEPSDGVQADFERATVLAARMLRVGLENDNFIAIPGESDKEFMLRFRDDIAKILRARMSAVQSLLSRHRPFLEAVAEALATQKTLFEADILQLKGESEGDDEP